MSGTIPRDHRWCSHCRVPDRYGPCMAHRDENGALRLYSGPDAYDASPWVRSVVGKYFASHGGPRDAGRVTWQCVGYDPRHGFWMVDVANADQQTNVSERAIGRTYHRVDRPAKNAPANDVRDGAARAVARLALRQPANTLPTVEQHGKMTTYWNVSDRGRSVLEGHHAEVRAKKSIRIFGAARNDGRTPAFDRTFRVGDMAVHSAYNLTYTGTITSIGPKVVTIVDGSETRRLSVRDFTFWNRDYDVLQTHRHNQSELQCI